MCQSLPSFPVIGRCYLLLKAQAKDPEPSTTPASDNTSSFDVSSPLKPSSLPSARARTEGCIYKRKSSRRARHNKSIKDDDRVSKSFIVSLA